MPLDLPLPPDEEYTKRRLPVPTPEERAAHEGGGGGGGGAIFPCQYCGASYGTAEQLSGHLVNCPQAPWNVTGGGTGGGAGPQEGDTKTDSYGTWTYQNGQWRLTGPAGGGGGAGGVGGDVEGGGYPVGSPEWWELVGGARPGYMSALGLLGKEYQNPWEQYMAGQYDPLQTMWQMASPMSMMGYPSMDPGTGMFSQWAPQYAQDPSAMYRMARGMLGSAMGMSPEQRGSLGMGGGGGSFADLLGMGLRTQLGPGAKWLAGRVPQLQQQWMAQDPQSQGPNFIDYIRDKYKLSQWL